MSGSSAWTSSGELLDRPVAPSGEERPQQDAAGRGDTATVLADELEGLLERVGLAETGLVRRSVPGHRVTGAMVPGYLRAPRLDPVQPATSDRAVYYE